MSDHGFRLVRPAFAVVAILGMLAVSLDHGVSLGLGRDALVALGRVYFALLLLAPLIIYPLAWRARAEPWERVLLSLLPGFIWWMTELPVRLRWNTPPEALWLTLSPFNLAHLYCTGVAIVLADSACRIGARISGRDDWRPGWQAIVGMLAGVILGPIAILATVFPFLQGFQAAFQTDMLPTPRSLPGPLEPGDAKLARSVDRPPNVVFILSDDHRYDFTGYAGHEFVETPSLDRLAAEGVRFSRAYVTSSLCSPSRASFMTGSYPHRHGVWNNFTPWSNENRTFLEYLSQVGYKTAFVGKWHMPGGLPELRGVDHFVTFTTMGGQGVYEWCPLVVDGVEEPSRTRYIATELTDRALEWLDDRTDQPFALVLSHKNVHADFRPDEPEQGRYQDAPVTLPEGAHPWTHFTNAQYVHLTPPPLDDAIRVYGESITSMDREIGRVLDFLDAEGLRENTVVIYASDNGYFWGERGLVDKRWPYELSIRVPFLVRYPDSGHLAGSTVDSLVANVDVAPTLLDLAGLDIPERMQGGSLVPLLTDPDAAIRDSFLYSYYFEPPYPAPTAQAIVTESEKLIDYDGLPTEVYDLRNDPHETTNLGPDSPSAVGLGSRLGVLLDHVGD